MKKRKRLLVILSTFVMAAQPMCVAAEMQDAEGFGAVEEIWADEENEEEFSAAPEGRNEDLNGFQAEISTEENDRIEDYRKIPVNSVNTAFQGVLSNDKSVICLPRQCLMDAVKALILLDFLGINQ